MIRLNFTYLGIEIQVYKNGVPIAPDSTPTAVLFRDGVSSGVTVTIASTADVGRYLASFTTLGTAQGWSTSNHLTLRATAIISTVIYPMIIFDSFSQFADDAINARLEEIKTNTSGSDFVVL